MVYQSWSNPIFLHNQDIVYMDKNKFVVPHRIFLSKVIRWIKDGTIHFDHEDDKKTMHVVTRSIACNGPGHDWRNQVQ